ncbi:ATP-binding protein [Sphingosinicella sp. GR2756]|uniref:ATP-binding protein n=2 Tax=Sphingosinicella rhizophila TaxID=3050082 RepID=A0ABU3QA81_9SPHN|nr:ATP-binding protein [Sphingosinicella sp. GR2756]MDT9600320.1 ATP-binding protein [Sphingosinicella sp. GR2756]
MGTDGSGQRAAIDLEELLATRLLVQGNSGSGKSHLLRRLLEGSAGLVQQIVIDPEGDFTSLSDAFSHVSIDAADQSLAEIGRIAARIRAHRASVVLNLEGLEMEGQMRCVAAFLGALFDAPREHWYPALVVVDEAQVFAPAVAGEVSDEARRTSLGAMTNLMCRGRKRGLAGVIATQRLAKLAKNVAAEASNFLMGRTFLDIDMARAADLLGMERRQAEVIRDLSRGQFLALGPAISRRPISIHIGDVRTAARSASPKLVPLPSEGLEDMEDLLFSPGAQDVAPPPPPPPPVSTDQILRTISDRTLAPVPDAPVLSDQAQEEVMVSVFAEIAAEAGLQPPASVFQDFISRCRMRGASVTLDMAAFNRRLALARAGIVDGEGWDDVIALAASLPEEMLAPFLGLARAAREGAPCPEDAELAILYGTTSGGRARRMLSFIEEKGLIHCRTDLSGKRSVTLPHFGWTTAPAIPDPQRPPRMARIAAREAAR